MIHTKSPNTIEMEKNSTMKLLITGASGNIGTVLCTRLQKNNIPFIGLDITNQDPTNDNFFQLLYFNGPNCIF